jgi:hypothetical protein
LHVPGVPAGAEQSNHRRTRHEPDSATVGTSGPLVSRLRSHTEALCSFRPSRASIGGEVADHHLDLAPMSRSAQASTPLWNMVDLDAGHRLAQPTMRGLPLPPTRSDRTGICFPYAMNSATDRPGRQLTAIFNEMGQRRRENINPDVRSL